MKRSFNHIIHAMGRRCRRLSLAFVSDHILILGGGRAALGIVRAVVHDEVLRDRQILIVAKKHPRVLHDYIFSQLTREEQQAVDLMVMYGERCHDGELKAARLSKASHVFIVGDEEDADRDARNVACWHKVRDSFEMQVAEPSRLTMSWQRGKAEKEKEEAVVQCQLYLYDEASVKLLHALQQESHTRMETTVVNYYEVLARQLLVCDTLTDQDRSLDRGLVAFDNDRYVHMVVLGMSPMGCAMAATAAQLCHFPNFDETSAHPVRTKITFVDPQADVLMRQYRARHAALFDLSHYVLRTDANEWQEGRPQAGYGDFVDVEWEFWKGTSADEWVRQLLTQSAADSRQVLSIAVCGTEGWRNLDEALALPSEVYRVPDDCETQQNIPMVYLYQPEEAALALDAHSDILRYRNLIPFGTHDFDPFCQRRTTAAKQMNYLLTKDPKHAVSMPEAEQLDSLWLQLNYDEKMSCLGMADAVFTQLRAVAGLLPRQDDAVGEALLSKLACVEQARWNVERLMVGYRAMPSAERQTLNAAIASADEQVRREGKVKNKRCANHLYVLKDIGPAAEMTEARRQFRYTLYRNIIQTDAKMVRTIQNATAIVNCRKTEDTSVFPEI